MKTTDRQTLQNIHIEGVKQITPSNAINLFQKQLSNDQLFNINEQVEKRIFKDILN